MPVWSAMGSGVFDTVGNALEWSDVGSSVCRTSAASLPRETSSFTGEVDRDVAILEKLLSRDSWCVPSGAEAMDGIGRMRKNSLLQTKLMHGVRSGWLSRVCLGPGHSGMTDDVPQVQYMVG